MKLLYLDCFSGASGDMLLAALLDAGAAEADVRDALASLALDGWRLEVSEVKRGALRALKVDVTTSTAPSRSPADIDDILRRAALAPGVRARAARTFEALARAEAKVHGVPLEEVHFHEVGALDAIVDVVAVSAALETLAPRVVVCSPIVTGRGTATSEHGAIPVPGPAAVELLDGAVLRIEGDGELLTPTGAALLATNVDRFGVPPPFTLSASGYGAGTRLTDPPNVLRVLTGELTEEPAGDGSNLVIETNLDDMSPELVPYVIERLLAAGAQDAWTSPITMKKGRPALTLSVLAGSEMLDPLLEVLYGETTTLGVRLRHVSKLELDRTWVTVQVAGYDVRVKVGMRAGQAATVSPEYEDAAKVARITGQPLKDVYRLAVEEAWRTLQG